jgi:molecular chaperone DnaK
MKEVKESLKGGDSTAIRAAADKLNEAWQAASAELYKAASEKAKAGKAAPESAAGAGKAEGSSGKSTQGDGPIIDAEVVDEKKS